MGRAGALSAKSDVVRNDCGSDTTDAPDSHFGLFADFTALAGTVFRVPQDAAPSHLQEVHAELVAGLPVPDDRGGVHHGMPALRTSADHHACIRDRTAMWKASRKR